MSYPDFTERKLSSDIIFEGKLLHVYKDSVMLPDGNTSHREYIRHVGAVCVVPITENDCVVVSGSTAIRSVGLRLKFPQEN